MVCTKHTRSESNAPNPWIFQNVCKTAFFLTHTGYYDEFYKKNGIYTQVTQSRLFPIWVINLFFRQTIRLNKIQDIILKYHVYIMQIKIIRPIDKHPHSPSSLRYQQNIRQVAQTTLAMFTWLRTSSKHLRQYIYV